MLIHLVYCDRRLQSNTSKSFVIISSTDLALIFHTLQAWFGGDFIWLGVSSTDVFTVVLRNICG